jgi:hypothetical protein
MAHSKRAIYCVCILTVLNLAAFLLPAANAQKLEDIPGVIDPTQTDILGLRLSMSSKEAIAVLEQRFHVKAQKPCPTTQLNCIRVVHKGDTLLSQGKGSISAVIFQNDTVTISLEFIENFPLDPSKPELLDLVLYHPSVLKTEADREAFKAQLIEKYGQPASFSLSGVSWCTRGFSFPSTDPITHKSKRIYGCDSNGPILEDSVGSLSLRDPRIERRITEAWQKSRTSSRPPL